MMMSVVARTGHLSRDKDRRNYNHDKTFVELA